MLHFSLKGNHVTLYSCARNMDEPLALPLSSSPSGPTCEYRPPSLWIDLFRSIVASRRFIYITGWSVYTDLKLLRLEFGCRISCAGVI